jgi:putative flavoprotein involved in K+ transport
MLGGDAAARGRLEARAASAASSGHRGGGIPNIRILRPQEFRKSHSLQRYEDGEAWKGGARIGTGNSGHDIAQDLYSAGAKVTIVQRSPTLITNCDPSAQLVYSLYSEGPPLEDCDLITASVPLALARKTHQLATEHAKQLDKDLLERLERQGFRLCDGEDGTGWQFMYLTRGGGYYFIVGCSDLIADGKIGLARFDELGELLKDADLVVLATGWKGQEHLVAKLFGAEVAARVGPIWGFGEGQELRNMFQRTPQPGLWFIAGSLRSAGSTPSTRAPDQGHRGRRHRSLERLSAGGAISVTRSAISTLFGSGSSVVSFSVSRVVQA